MLLNLKALVVVLAVAVTVFVVAKPICLRFMSELDFARRRNIWLVLTIAAFVSPNFWIFVLIAFAVLGWGAHKESNPLALYVLLYQIIPHSISFELPVVGINSLFPLDWGRILSFTVLVPVALRLLTQPKLVKKPGHVAWVDALLLAFFAMQVVVMMPYESMTASARRALLLYVDLFAVYYVGSRTCNSRRLIAEVMACFVLVCCIWAPLAVFETVKGWLLYGGIGNIWGSPIPFAWLFRSGMLRAQVSAGQSITLGQTLVVAFAFWLYLASRVGSKRWLVGIACWIWAGMLASLARAPWLVGIVIFLTYSLLAPKGIGVLVKGLMVISVAAAVLAISPFGDRVIASLPFVGKHDQASVEYRERFAERSWEEIRRHPIAGNPLVLKNLEDLRQGQGIIDLINTYATVGMYYGLVGLFLFVFPFLIAVWEVFTWSKGFSGRDLNAQLLGVSLFACAVGILVMAVTVLLSEGSLIYLLLGMLVGYRYIREQATSGSDRVAAWGSGAGAGQNSVGIVSFERAQGPE